MIAKSNDITANLEKSSNQFDSSENFVDMS